MVWAVCGRRGGRRAGGHPRTNKTTIEDKVEFTNIEDKYPHDDGKDLPAVPKSNMTE